jgi:hypothetical protein
MAEHPTPGKPESDSSLGIAASELAAAALKLAEGAGALLEVRKRLQDMLQQAGELRGLGAFTPGEHERLRAVLLAALQRLGGSPEAGTGQRGPGAKHRAAWGEALEAVEVEAADPAEVVEAVDVEDAGEEVYEAAEVVGAADQGEVLVAEDLPDRAANEEEYLEALDLGGMGAAEGPEVALFGEVSAADSSGLTDNLGGDFAAEEDRAGTDASDIVEGGAAD